MEERIQQRIGFGFTAMFMSVYLSSCLPLQDYMRRDSYRVNKEELLCLREGGRWDEIEERCVYPLVRVEF